MILIYIVTVIESKVHTQVLIVDKAVNWIGYWQDTQDSAWPQQVPTDPGLGALAPEQSVRPGPRPGRDRQDHGQKGKVNSKVQIYRKRNINDSIGQLFTPDWGEEIMSNKKSLHIVGNNDGLIKIR